MERYGTARDVSIQLTRRDRISGAMRRGTRNFAIIEKQPCNPALRSTTVMFVLRRDPSLLADEIRIS